MDWLDRRPNKHPLTASRLVDGQAVIVLPEEGKVQVLNAVGSRIWELADGSRTARAIAQAIYEEYDVEHDRAEREVTEFIMEMVQRDLMTVEPPA